MALKDQTMNHKSFNIGKLGHSIWTPNETLTQLHHPSGMQRNVIVFQEALPDYFKKPTILGSQHRTRDTTPQQLNTEPLMAMHIKRRRHSQSIDR